MNDSVDADPEYLVPRVRSVATIFGIVFFADLVACDDSVNEENAVAIRSIGPFADPGDANAAAIRQYWTQYRD